MFTHNNNPFNPQARRARRARPPAVPAAPARVPPCARGGLARRPSARDTLPPPLTPHPSTAAEPQAMRTTSSCASRPRRQRLSPSTSSSTRPAGSCRRRRPPAQDARRPSANRRRRREHLRRGRRFARVVRMLGAAVGDERRYGYGRRAGRARRGQASRLRIFYKASKNSGLWRHKRSSPGGTRSRRAHALRRRRRRRRRGC